jgi:hypothetical protein
MHRMTRVTGTAAIAGLIAASGCGIVGPSCLDRQKTGDVTTVSGTVEAGQVTSHLIPYDTRGSQNDARIRFTGQGTLTGPRIMVYATDARCDAFKPPPADNPVADQGLCTPFEWPGGYLGPDGALVPTTLTITGPGNGAPAGFHEYKLFIVGDPKQMASYTISITWFSGPDC